MRLVNFVVIVFFNNVPVVPVVPWFYMGSGIGPMPMHDVVVMAVRNAVKWKPPPSLPL